MYRNLIIILLISTVSYAGVDNPGGSSGGGVTALTCAGNDKFSAVTGAGVFTCTTDQTTAGGNPVISPGVSTVGRIVTWNSTTGSYVTELTGTGFNVVNNGIASVLTGTGMPVSNNSVASLMTDTGIVGMNNQTASSVTGTGNVGVLNSVPTLMTVRTVNTTSQFFWSATAAAVTSQSVPVIANAAYGIMCNILQSSSTTTSGPRFAIAAPATTSVAIQTLRPVSATTTSTGSAAVQWSTPCTGCDGMLMTSLTSTNRYILYGTAIPTSAGSLTLYVASSMTRTVSPNAIRPGTYCDWERLY